MKKFLLTFLSLVMCCLSMSANKIKFSANGDTYQDCTKTFTNSLSILTLFSSDFSELDMYKTADNVVKTNTLNPFGTPDTPADVEDYYSQVYVTTDGSDPTDVENANRVLVFGTSPDMDYTVNRIPVVITKTSVVRAAYITSFYAYTYEKTGEDSYYVVGKEYTWTKKMKDDAYSFVTHNVIYQTYICADDLKSATPTIEMIEEGIVNKATNSFITSAKAKISSSYKIPEGLEDYISVSMNYTADGSCPSPEFIKGNTTVDDIEVNLSSTSDIKAQVFVYASYGDDELSEDPYFNSPAASDEAAAKFTKLDVTEPQQMVLDKAYWVDGEDDDAHHFGLTYGVNVKNIKYGGAEYSVLTDGKASFLVKNGDLDENTAYFVGGTYSWGEEDLLGMPGFGLETTEEGANTFVTIGNDNAVIPQSAPALYTSETIESVFDTNDIQPLVNVAFPVSGFVAANGTASVGTENVKIVNIEDLAAAKTDEEVELYDGEALLSGIVFGCVGSTILVYADDIYQEEQIIFSEPAITLKKEKNVDSTKDQTATIDFTDSYELVNENLDASATKLYFNVSLRTIDGNVIVSEQKSVSLSDPKLEYNISKSDITPDLEYVITVDDVVATNADAFPIAGTEYDKAKKSFTTIAPKLLNQSVSVFDGAITVPVLNVESLDINDKEEIKLYNNVTGEEVKYQSVSASGNKVTLVVGEGGFSTDVPYVTGLNFGQYTLVLGAEALKVDEFINPKELSMEIIAGSDADKARIDALSDLDRCLTIVSNAPKGVNIFQYTPATVQKFYNAIYEAGWELTYDSENKLAAADDIKAANKKLLDALYQFRPTLPQGNKTYTIRTNKTVLNEETGSYDVTLGKYFNIDGDKVALSDTPSYIQFHMVENQFDEYFESITSMDPNNGYGSIDGTKFSYAPYTWYLYNTKNRSYVYSEYERKTDKDGDFYHNLVLTDNRHIASTFRFCTTGFNEWLMYTSTDPEAMPYPVVYNKTEVFTAYDERTYTEDFAKFVEETGGHFSWFIAQEDQPEEEATPEESGSEADDATAITSAQAASMNAEFYSTSGARLQSPKKGVNIVKFSNGQIKKYLVK